MSFTLLKKRFNELYPKKKKKTGREQVEDGIGNKSLHQQKDMHDEQFPTERERVLIKEDAWINLFHRLGDNSKQ